MTRTPNKPRAPRLPHPLLRLWQRRLRKVKRRHCLGWFRIPERTDDVGRLLRDNAVLRVIRKESVVREGRGALQFLDVHSVYDLIQRVSNRLLRAERMTSKDRTAVCAERISGSGGLPEGPYDCLRGM